MASHTSRTLELLRSRGWRCQIVERWNSFAKKRIDLFGFIDIVCLTGDEIVGVQSTGYTNHSSHLRKIQESDALDKWLESGGKVLLVSWKKVKQGRRKWLPRAEWVVKYRETYKVIPFSMDEEVRTEEAVEQEEEQTEEETA